LPVGFEIDGLPGGDDRLLRLGMAIEAVLEPLHRRPSAIVEARAGLMKSEHIMRPTHMPVTLRLPWALGDNRAYAASRKD
jgi:hypothetical protein